MESFPHHNFIVIALIIMNFGTYIKLDVLYTMVTNILCDVTTEIISCILDAPNSQTLFTDLAEIWYLELFWCASFKYQVRSYF